MNRDEQPRHRRPLLWVYLLAAFALTSLLGFSDEVLAQSQWTTNGDNISNTNSGNVGIGTTIPTFPLTIEKDYNGAANISVFNTADGSSAQASIGVSRTTNYSNKYFTLGVTAPSFSAPGYGETAYFHSGGVPLKFGTGSAHDIYFFTNGITNTRLTITSGGNVGIGTTSPGSKLHVYGSGTYNDGLRLQYSGSGTPWNIVQGQDSQLYVGYGTAITAMVADTTGKIGIGTYTPSYKLDVAGQIRSSSGGFVFPDGTVQATAATGSGTGAAANVSAGQFGSATGGGNYSFPANVGVGTASPTFLLDVWGSANSPFRVRDGSGREYFSTATRTGTYGTVPVVSIAGRLIIDSNGPEGANDTVVRRGVNSLIFSPSDTSGLPGAFMVRQVGGSSILHIDQNTNGNVGIGTAPNSQYKVDINGNTNITGNINVTGNINAKYQDVAEWVPSREKLSAGTVVVLDTQLSNHVIASSSAYDTRVAGVVSAQPGVILGEAGENKLMVATTGRVKIKVDASRAAIHVGDLLVTSDKEGVAMKSEPLSLGGTPIHRPGTLIGKALEPFEKGTGEILVLLSLQ